MRPLHALLALALAVLASSMIVVLPVGPLTTVVASELGYALAALVALRLEGQKGGLPLQIPGPRPMLGALVLGAGVFLFSSCSLARLYNLGGGSEYTELLQRVFTEIQAQIGLAGILVLTVVLVPLCEETLFRGVVQRALRRRFGPGVAIVLAAVLFGLFHGHPVHLLVAFVLGLAAGYALEATGTLWAPILVHAANNGAAILSGLGIRSVEGGDTAVLPGWFVLPAVLLVGVGGWLVGRPALGLRRPGNEHSTPDSAA